MVSPSYATEIDKIRQFNMADALQLKTHEYITKVCDIDQDDIKNVDVAREIVCSQTGAIYSPGFVDRKGFTDDLVIYCDICERSVYNTRDHDKFPCRTNHFDCVSCCKPSRVCDCNTYRNGLLCKICDRPTSICMGIDYKNINDCSGDLKIDSISRRRIHEFAAIRYTYSIYCTTGGLKYIPPGAKNDELQSANYCNYDRYADGYLFGQIFDCVYYYIWDDNKESVCLYNNYIVTIENNQYCFNRIININGNSQISEDEDETSEESWSCLKDPA